MDVSMLLNHDLPEEIPDILRARGILTLNRIQSEALEKGLLLGENLVVSAPTSAGKTLLGELVALRHAPNGCTFFLVSHKALAREIHSLFQRSYQSSTPPILRAGILTGDTDSVRGEWSAFDIIVSTYEKFYASLASSAHLKTRARAIIIDELQTVGEPERGPALELLIARLRLWQRVTPLQIVGLSATAPNSRHLSDWLEANLVLSTTRTPPLDYEIWLPGQRRLFVSGEDSPRVLENTPSTTSVSEIVEELLRRELSPVVVMGMTRREVLEYTEAIAEQLPLHPKGSIAFISEFRAVGDQSDTTEKVCALLPKGVGVHSADLTYEQQTLIENALRERVLDVLCATTTLVAGVNLPIRTIVYPKLTRWKGPARGEEYIGLREFLNGAGRAGRTGHYERGTCIIRAETLPEARRISQAYLAHEPEPVESQLENRSREYFVLHLLAGLRKTTIPELAEAASRTLWCHDRGLNRGEDALDRVLGDFLEVLYDERLSRCWNMDGEDVEMSRLGDAIVGGGLEPRLALEVSQLLECFYQELEGRSDEKCIRALLLQLCHSRGVDEFLPYYGAAKREWAASIRGVVPSEGNPWDGQGLVGFGHALIAIADDSLPEHTAERMKSGFRAERSRICEHLARLIAAGVWVLEAEDPVRFEAATEQLNILGAQLEFQVPAKAVPFARLFRQHRVRNVGLRRATKLAELCGGELGRVLKLDNSQVASAVGRAQVAAVKEAVLHYLGGLTREQSKRQLEEAKRAGDRDFVALVQSILGRVGERAEPPIKDALARLGWQVEKIPEALEGRKADLRGMGAGGMEVLVECKTTEELASEVSEQEALSILKAIPAGFSGALITVGRPVFSAPAVEKALRRKSQDPPLHLVTVGALVELLLLQVRSELPPRALDELVTNYVHVDVARVRRLVWRARNT